MPIYTFKCNACQNYSDIRLSNDLAPKIGETVQLKCFGCGKKEVTRVILSSPAMAIGEPIKKQPKGFDGFGWHDGLNMSFKGPKDYRDHLKREGLVEMGDAPPPTPREHKTELLDDETLRDLNNAGLKVSGQEAKALKSGEYMKSAEFKKDLEKLKKP